MGLSNPILKGKLRYDTYIKVLNSFSDRLILSVPYINGEPLLSKDIYKAIQAASSRNIGTLIASNGILLNETNSLKLLEANLDCLKVHISGFTKTVHAIEHRRGDVERIKQNLVRFMKLRNEKNAKTIVLLDFIRYEHNKHEIEQARSFARKYGLLFSIRPGNPKGMEATEPLQSTAPLPQHLACDWLWTVLTIDWNGAVYPCCDHVMWSSASAYGMADQDDLNLLWTGPKVKKMRQVHITKGRQPIPICAQCPRQGVKFKW
jgi:radical SAM protein with 4Fe4S-binding SPASM domain